MKFDIISFIENYKVLVLIAGNEQKAMLLCGCISVIVWALSYMTVGEIFKWIGFSGNSKRMSATYAVISTILTSIFYIFLDFFQKPLAWIFQNFKAIACAVLLIWLAFTLISLVFDKM